MKSTWHTLHAVNVVLVSDYKKSYFFCKNIIALFRLGPKSYANILGFSLYKSFSKTTI